MECVYTSVSLDSSTVKFLLQVWRLVHMEVI